MGDFDERVRQQAYRLWVEEGCPEGRADVHWDKARELVSIEQNQTQTTRPVAREAKQTPVEPASAMKNLGEFPTLTDQGEGKVAPEREKAESKAAPRPAAGKTTSKKAAAPRATAAAAARQASGKKTSDGKGKAPAAKPH